MQVKREHLAGLCHAIDEIGGIASGEVTATLNRLIAEAQAAPEVEPVATIEVVVEGTCKLIDFDGKKAAFKLPAGVHNLYANHSEVSADANLYRQWFNAVQDLNPKFLEPADYAAAARLGKP